MKLIFIITLILSLSPLASSRLSGNDDDSDRIAHRKLQSNNRPISGSYIVQFNDNVQDVNSKAAEILAAAGSQGQGQGPPFVKYIYESAIKGLNIQNLPPQALANIFGVTDVEVVEEDGEVDAIVEWGLDRIDQLQLPLDGAGYASCYGTGESVTVFIIDTGIQSSHDEFSGRVNGELSRDFTSNADGWADGNGHGTHCAGTAVGASVGVANNAKVAAVKVLSDSGSGTVSGVIAGVNYVAGLPRQSGEQYVASMSLGGGRSSTLNNAVAGLRTAGVPVAVAAGNDNRDASNYSPASELSAITVGSSTRSDSRSSFSNYGSALDIFAPGSAIRSAWISGDSAYNTISGTSMATPHVAGALASMWSSDLAMSTQSLESKLIAAAAPNLLTSIGSGSPNLLLQVCPGDGGDPPAEPNPPPESDPPQEPEPEPEPERQCKDLELFGCGEKCRNVPDCCRCERQSNCKGPPRCLATWQ